mgnify:CR=1 FL=1
MTDRHLIHDDDAAAPAGGAGPRAIAVAAGIVALVGLAGFAGWLAHGDTLFWSMLQAGLAWCM